MRCSLIMALILSPSPLAAIPRWVSRICPTFIREGTPKRVEHDIHRLPVLVVRHILNRHDDRDNTLVTVPASHLVSRLDAALDRQVNLDDLEYARGQVIAALQLALLVLEPVLQQLVLLFHLALGRGDGLVELSLGQFELEPLVPIEVRQHCRCQRSALGQASATHGLLALEQVLQAGVR